MFLGFPIWGLALPVPVQTFLTTHDLSGKTVVPFITHGGYGTGSAPETLAGFAHCVTKNKKPCVEGTASF